MFLKDATSDKKDFVVMKDSGKQQIALDSLELVLSNPDTVRSSGDEDETDLAVISYTKKFIKKAHVLCQVFFEVTGPLN